MSDYKLATDEVEGGVIRYSDGASIPNTRGNRDWMEYEKYVAEGGLTDPWKTDAELAEQASCDAVAAISEERWAKETTDLPYDGMLFKYSREDRTLLESAVDKIRRGLVSSITWKCADGYYELTADKVDGLEIAGLAQVQGAFLWEKSALEALEAV